MSLFPASQSSTLSHPTATMIAARPSSRPRMTSHPIRFCLNVLHAVNEPETSLDAHVAAACAEALKSIEPREGSAKVGLALEYVEPCHLPVTYSLKENKLRDSVCGYCGAFASGFQTDPHEHHDYALGQGDSDDDGGGEGPTGRVGAQAQHRSPCDRSYGGVGSMCCHPPPLAACPRARSKGSAPIFTPRTSPLMCTRVSCSVILSTPSDKAPRCVHVQTREVADAIHHQVRERVFTKFAASRACSGSVSVVVEGVGSEDPIRRLRALSSKRKRGFEELPPFSAVKHGVFIDGVLRGRITEEGGRHRAARPDDVGHCREASTVVWYRGIVGRKAWGYRDDHEDDGGCEAEADAIRPSEGDCPFVGLELRPRDGSVGIRVSLVPPPRDFLRVGRGRRPVSSTSPSPRVATVPTPEEVVGALADAIRRSGSDVRPVVVASSGRGGQKLAQLDTAATFDPTQTISLTSVSDCFYLPSNAEASETIGRWSAAPTPTSLHADNEFGGLVDALPIRTWCGQGMVLRKLSLLCVNASPSPTSYSGIVCADDRRCPTEARILVVGPRKYGTLHIEALGEEDEPYVATIAGAAPDGADDTKVDLGAPLLRRLCQAIFAKVR